MCQMTSSVDNTSVASEILVGAYETDLPFDHLLLYHQLWRALLNGQSSPSRRAPLPVELIRIISQLANLVIRDRELSYVEHNGIVVSSNDGGGHESSKIWFTSKPFNKITMAHVAGAQLTTYSHDQGWADQVDHGSWTWFDMAVAPFPLFSPSEDKAQRPKPSGKREKTATESLPWRVSHRNEVASRPARCLQGRIVTSDDEMWDNVQSGQPYVIAVRANARYPGWTNYALEGELRVWKYFEPVVAL